ncbi:MAG: hypothetical protein QOF00_824 [Pseudonocardiales bacterium]|jgi:hypothetical protein|nr:hypothetical protein [Pseudonocardiales bacterium]
MPARGVGQPVGEHLLLCGLRVRQGERDAEAASQRTDEDHTDHDRVALQVDRDVVDLHDVHRGRRPDAAGRYTVWTPATTMP